MKANLTTFAAISLGALLAFFPIFNQVRDQALEAISHAKEIKGQRIPDALKELPDDEQIDYYDGRLDPGEAGGDLDESRIAKDGKFKHPDDRWEWKNPEDAEYADEVGEENVSYRLEERKDPVFEFIATRSSDRYTDQRRDMTFLQEYYDSYKVTCSISGFYGSFSIRVQDDDGRDVGPTFHSRSPGVDLNQGYGDSDCAHDYRPDDGIHQVEIDFESTPAFTNEKFEYRITGTYFVKVRA